MNYTVIHKSGWQGSHWVVGKVCDNKKEAEAFLSEHRTAEAMSDYYHMRVMAHRKPITSLMLDDASAYRFSDGTVAWM